MMMSRDDLRRLRFFESILSLVKSLLFSIQNPAIFGDARSIDIQFCPVLAAVNYSLVITVEK
jgi:hypothetical protein